VGRGLDRSAQLCVEAFDGCVVDGFAIASELVGALADGIDQTLDGRHEVLEASRDLDEDAAGGRSCRFASPRILDGHPSSDRERRFLVQVTCLQHVEGGRWLGPHRLWGGRRSAQGEIQAPRVPREHFTSDYEAIHPSTK
jgi:hypothetical protein